MRRAGCACDDLGCSAIPLMKPILAVFVGATAMQVGCVATREPTTPLEPDLPATLAIGRDEDLKVLALEQLDRTPKVLRRVPPKYPSELRKAGVEGVVVVQFTVDSSGVVRDATAISSPNSDLAKLAEIAISNWAFEPGMRAGHPVSCQVVVPITFAIGAR